MGRYMVLVAVMSMFLMSGCNTVQGIGKDLEKAGEAVQKSTK